MRRKKLLAGLICATLFVTDILPVGFSVSANELEQEDFISEKEESAEEDSQEECVSENESSIAEANTSEEFVSTVEEVKVTEFETESEAGKEETSVEDTEVQDEEISKDSIEIETQEESSTIEETESIDMESDTSEQELIVNTSGDDIASGRYEDITWVIDADGKLTVTGTGDFANFEYDYYRAPWSDNGDSITSAEINVTGAKNAGNMFYGCSNLKSVDLRGFDTSNVMSMKDMFHWCSNLTSVDMSGCDTGNVQSMRDMFHGCSNLTSVDVSGFDTSNVTDMSLMFRDCSSLTSVNVSGFNTGNVTDMSLMFGGCNSLASVDVSGFNTENVTDMSGMFGGCNSLANVDVSGFDTKNVTNMSGMFGDCNSLASVDVSGFDTKNVTDTEGMFGGCENLANIDVSSFDTGNVTYMMGMFSSCSNLVNIDVSGFDTRNVISMYEMFQGCNSLTSVDVSGFDTGNVVNMEYMFSECRSLTSVDVSGFDTKNVTNMYEMFGGCNSLASVDVSGFDTKNVTDMEGMFGGCMSLTNIDASSFDTSNVTSMQWMFSSCSNLVNIDVSSFDTRNVMHMYGMFEGCNSLTSLNISNFDTSNVASMGSMFYGCNSLASLDVNGFNTTNVTDMNGMFWDCNSLASLDISGFDTSNVVDMGGMFSECNSLTSVDVSGFDTKNVTNMEGMFSECSSLTSVDVSGFDTKNVTNMGSMFYGCKNLVNLDMSSFDVGKVIECDNLFYACTSLATIDTPCNLKKSVSLPKKNTEDIWHQPDGTIITELPQNLSYSIRITKDTNHTVPGENIASGSYKDITWSIDAKGKLTVTGTGDFSDSVNYDRAPWHDNRKSIVSAKIDVDNMTNASYMFYGCENMIHIDVSSFDTSQVTSMDSMFSGCRSLTGIAVNGFDISDVTSMYGMFADCSSLTNIKVFDVYTNNTKNAIDMRYMFKNCSKLEYLDLSGFDLKHFESGETEKNIEGMLDGCINLTTVYTPCNLTQSVLLPKGEAGDIWYQSDDTQITELPQNLDHSIIITKNGSMAVSGSYKGITWNINNKGKLAVKGTGDFAEPTDGKYHGNHSWVDTDRAPWSAYKELIETAEVSVTGMTDASYMFNECRKLKSIELEELNTESITNMIGMFCRCESLEHVDVSKFNTKNVTNMGAMFYRCLELTSIDVSNFDTSEVTNMSSMFGECPSLETLDVSGFDTSKVTSMSSMFWSCCSLKALDVSGFDTSNVTSMGSMFTGCANLTSLDMSGFDVSKVTGSNYMFLGISWTGEECGVTTLYTPCNLGVSIDLPSGTWYQPDGTVITELPKNLPYSILISKNTIPTVSAPHIAANKGKKAYKCGETLNTDDLIVRFYGTDGTVKVVTDYSTNINEIDMSTAGIKTLIITYNDLTAEIKLTVTGAGSASGSYKDITWSIDAEGKLTVTGTGDFSDSAASDRAPWYAYRDTIKSAKVDVDNMTNASYMFNECGNMASVDVSGFDTENVTNMESMFFRCKSLINVDVSKFDTKNVTDMGQMFYRCMELVNINVSSFDTGNVKNMFSMFGECLSLETLDVSDFDTGNVTNMGQMFWCCDSLKTLDVSRFDTSKVTDMSRMFQGCVNLTSLDMSGFDVSNMTETSDMLGSRAFGECGATTIYTPCNLADSVVLPSGTWYQPDGIVITELPKNLPYSILISKDTIPTVSAPHIIANKGKKAYKCGETLNTDDLTVRFYGTDGTVKEVTDYSTNINEIDMSTAGIKTLIITYNDLTAEIKLTVTEAPKDKTCTVAFDLCGHGAAIAPITDISIGSLIAEPQSPEAEGYRFMGWYKDPDYLYKWNFYEDTVQENITLYACWAEIEEDTKIGSLYIQRIPTQFYTGSEVKPSVAVYYQSDGSKILLKAGADYTIKYYNNIEADTEQEKTLGGISQIDTGNGFTKELAYFVITCKGNYTGSVYQNFHIYPVSITDDGQNFAKGFTLNYTEQFATGTKSLKPFKSLKYKKNMKAGTDYNIQLTVQKAYDDGGSELTEGYILNGNSAIPEIPAGYRGAFCMSITGINNYEGTITKTIYVDDKNHLMKNASVSLGKNQKNMKYTGDAVVLTPGWYDADAKKYYVVSGDNKQTETDKKNVFTVKLGTEYLLYGRDFTVSYQRNEEVGTAVMTIIGIGDYAGTKNVSFRITGIAFNARNIRVSNFNASFIYTGEALTQDEVVLTDISGAKQNELVCGTDYTVDYKNNRKKGTATMLFTAKPKSGYSGSFKQTFKITAARLEEITGIAVADPNKDVLKTENGSLRLDGKILYTKEGAKPSDRIVLTNRNTNSVLKEGTDYTVSYGNNKAVTTNGSLAAMTIRGKGNYVGIITVSFPIVKAPLSDNENLTNATAAIAYNAKNGDDYQYLPKVKLMDRKKALSESKDYEVVAYKNCSQAAVGAYLKAMINGTAKANARPYAIVKAREESGYEGSLEVDLTIYMTKLSAKNLYIVMPEETAQVTYTGKQVTPEAAIYYGEAGAVEHAKNAGETKENILTDKSGSYKLTKLNSRENGMGDYTLAYGANITAGKNKGSIMVIGAGLYGGKVTVKFTILGKDVYEAKIERMKGAVALSAQLLGF